MYDVVRRTSETLLLAISEVYAGRTRTIHDSHEPQLPSPGTMSRGIQSLPWRSTEHDSKAPCGRWPAGCRFRYFPTGNRREKKPGNTNFLLRSRAKSHRCFSTKSFIKRKLTVPKAVPLPSPR